MVNPRKNIAVIGSSGFNDELADYSLDLAEEVGKKIAHADCVLLSGGRGGVMEAACKGAINEGGLTVGILPFDKGDSNPYLSVSIPTHLGFFRNALVVRSADAVIAVRGSVGTLSELAFALNYDVPVVVLKGSGGIADEIHLMPSIKNKLHYADSAEEAVDLAIRLCKND
ncbi:MAG: TIGR00725 family protein [Candidatus Kariarchaeaceae archaeon]